MNKQLAVSTAFLLFFAPILAAADVPQFRGTGGAGVADEKNLPTQWSDQENIRWKVALPGRGLSNPVIADGRAYVTAASGFEQKRLHVLCLDVKTGKQLWERQFWATGTTLCNPKTNMAAPTPATDGERVYALFATADLVCLDKHGDLVWYRSLAGDHPTIGNNVGMAASPTLWKDILIVPMENVGESFVAGIDANTGANRWRVERPRGINWTTPLVIDNGGKAEVILSTPGRFTAHNPATGKEVWRWDGECGSAPSPVAGDGMLFVPGGKLTALKLGNGAASPEVVWQNNKLATGYTSPTFYRGLVYTVSGRGVVSCTDPATGKVLWSERVDGTFSASPLAADGKIYVASEEGVVSVLQAGREARILATSSLPETFLASPVASDGALFLRSDKHLYCMRK
ncbi:MAG: PQQ-binding-like beta-propeller repeat protein [Gemmataceae bacterium]|nr:PQQ-binding-like beta-propeller repeat protein [Gemmataceae bacterium]